MAAATHTRFLSDSHFHSTAMRDRDLNPEEILGAFRDEYAGPLLDVAIQPEDSVRQRQLSGAISGVYYSCGLHPSKTDREDWHIALQMVERHISDGGYHAVGETGLDWFRMYAPRDRQRELFYHHLVLSRRSNLPVIVHNREADHDVLEMLRAADLSTMGVMHCFSSQPEWVRRFLDVGMYISFAGNLTFKNAQPLREAAKLVPDDRLLVETDAPFLAPDPVRGRPNHPGYLSHTVQRVADVRNTTPDRIGELVAENLARMIGVSVT